MATLADGYVYHTPLDSADRMDVGEMHRLGASTLSVARAALRAMEARKAARWAADAADAAAEAEVAAAQARAARFAAPPPRRRRVDAHDNMNAMAGDGPGGPFFD